MAPTTSSSTADHAQDSTSNQTGSSDGQDAGAPALSNADHSGTTNGSSSASSVAATSTGSSKPIPVPAATAQDATAAPPTAGIRPANPTRITTEGDSSIAAAVLRSPRAAAAAQSLTGRTAASSSNNGPAAAAATSVLATSPPSNSSMGAVAAAAAAAAGSTSTSPTSPGLTQSSNPNSHFFSGESTNFSSLLMASANGGGSGGGPFLHGPGYERELKAREYLLSDSDTESNLSSRPPSPDRHRFPKYRLSGMQSKDEMVVKLQDHLASSPPQSSISAQQQQQSLDAATAAAAANANANAAASHRLKLAREQSPYDHIAHPSDGPISAADLITCASPSPLTAVSGKTIRARTAGSTSTVTAAASSSKANNEPTRAASPPPRAMSPSKGVATTKLSSGTSSISQLQAEGTPQQQSQQQPPASPRSGSFVTPTATRSTSTLVPVATNASSSSTTMTTSGDKPPSASSRPDGRALFKRMLSGSGGNKDKHKDKDADHHHSSAFGGMISSSGLASPSASSRRSTPPGSPSEHSAHDTSALMSAVGSLNISSPPTSQPPSRNVSLRRKEGAGDKADPQQAPSGGGGRLTAAALRDLDAKGYTASGPGAGAAPITSASASASGKEKDGKKKSVSGKDADAKSTASSTLRDMIMGSAPKLSRRGSSASGGSKKGASQAGGGDNASLLKKYGVCEKAAIGKGATAVVRLAHKWDRSTEKLYAVKEFRKRRKNESEKEYVKKLTSEFCISSTLHHLNIVETVDLVQDENRHWCEVMEFCPGGDLYAAIKRGDMNQPEIECCFKQTMNGIAYLHSMGVAHRDIKPENLLLDAQGHVKITDFGVSDVFRMCWEKSTHYSKGLCGSEPYIAPEQFEQKGESRSQSVSA